FRCRRGVGAPRKTVRTKFFQRCLFQPQPRSVYPGADDAGNVPTPRGVALHGRSWEWALCQSPTALRAGGRSEGFVSVAAGYKQIAGFVSRSSSDGRKILGVELQPELLYRR